jgi:hypothetical protein
MQMDICCFDDCSIAIYFEIRKCDSSGSFLFEQDCFGYSGSFVVLYEFYDCFFLLMQRMALGF